MTGKCCLIMYNYYYIGQNSTYIALKRVRIIVHNIMQSDMVYSTYKRGTLHAKLNPTESSHH